MNVKLSILAIATVLWTTTCVALDLTPTREFRDLEGMRIPILSFADGKNKVSYQPPPSWKYSGGGELLDFLPPDQPNTCVSLRVSVKRTPAAADAAASDEALAKWCRSLLPQDATDPVLKGEVVSPFTLRNLGSHEFTFSYAAQGRRFMTSICAVDLNERERLALVITALPQEFKEARDLAIRSMFSWNWRD